MEELLEKQEMTLLERCVVLLFGLRLGRFRVCLCACVCVSLSPLTGVTSTTTPTGKGAGARSCWPTTSTRVRTSVPVCLLCLISFLFPSFLPLIDKPPT